MVKSFFSKEEGREITDAICEAERRTSGQIHVHVRKKCGPDALADAHRHFKRLGLHKTRQKNAVLIFVAPESKKLAIVGDQGIHEKVSDRFWDATRDRMLNFFKKNEIKNGIVAGIRSAGEELGRHFPSKAGDANDLPDTLTED